MRFGLGENMLKNLFNSGEPDPYLDLDEGWPYEDEDDYPQDHWWQEYEWEDDAESVEQT